MKDEYNAQNLRIAKRADEITDTLYAAYGTDTGILFGIPAQYKSVITTIIRFTLEEEDQ